MLTFKRVDSNNSDFRELVVLLDAELKIRDGADHAFYNQFNGLDDIGYALVAYQYENPIGCGALKKYDVNTLEVKRMFVISEQRNKGFARSILSALENWARELDFSRLILETGLKQPEAIALYQKSGYKTMENYDPYTNVENSRCFFKLL